MRSLLLMPLFILAVACSPAAPCDASTCAGCCDLRGACVGGDSVLACGVAGRACNECAAGQSCVVGVCGGSVPGDAGTGGGGGATGGGGGGSATGGGGGSATGGGGGSMGGGGGSTGGGNGAADGGTLLNGVFGTRMGVFDRAQHGLESDGGVIYVEAHFGGDPACPDQNSPTPARTLIIANLRAVSDGGVQRYDAGVRVTLLDFNGVLTTAPFLRAYDVAATPRSVTPGVAVSYDLVAVFDGGVISGQFWAPHCASLNGP